MVRLFPPFMMIITEWLDRCKEEKLEVLITSKYRSPYEQQKLYDQGRETPGKIVTMARPGYSFHNYGLAIDFVPLICGKPVWDISFFKAPAELAKKLGLEWGGDWKRKDYPHIQKSYGLTLSAAREILAKDGLSAVWTQLL